MKRFVALFDLHYGYERKHGHKVSLHDEAALGAALSFIRDFRPDHVILGGDMLDCGVISHHNKKKPGAVEGFRLLQDAKDLSAKLIAPLEKLAPGRLVYHIGNHEDWLNDLSDEIPGLEGLLDLRVLLGLSERWEVIRQGGVSRLGKLHFIHGDTLPSGEHAAKAAVINYEESVRFGHIHTFQTYTKNSAISKKTGKTGIAVPCLCKKDPKYGEGKPNKWVQGLLWGYVDEHSGLFNDYISVIVDGKFMANGKVYRG